MRLSLNVVAAVAAATALVSAVSAPAFAECKRFGFTVNDYGKDGPTKDAKRLLDTLISSKMSERGVKDYNTGKKSVSCELFLDFIVFDEHTCTAEATVCWGGSHLPGAEQASGETEDAGKKSTKSVEQSKPAKAKKKDLAKTSDRVIAKTKAASSVVADPKPTRARKAEAPTVEPEIPTTAAAETEAAAPVSDTAAAPSTTADAPASTETAAKSEAPAANPVETGSLNEPDKKTAKSAPASTHNNASAKKASTGESGYPTPVPPNEPAE